MSSTSDQHEAPTPQGVGKKFDAYADDYDRFYKSGTVDGRSFEYRNRQQLAWRLVEELLPPQASLLEFGCGAGHTAVELARRGHRLTCVDISEQMVAATRRTFATAGQSAEFYLGTVNDVPLDRGPFDGVLAMGVMDYIPQPESTLARVAELLKPGGVCLLSYANAATPLRWIEVPVKRGGALGLYLLTRDVRYRDIAFPRSKANTRRQLRAWYEQAGLKFERFEYFNFVLRFGPLAIPPIALASRWDASLGRSPVRFLGRGLVAVGRKPE